MAAPPADKEQLWFHPHLRKGKAGDKHVDKIVIRAQLAGFASKHDKSVMSAGHRLRPAACQLWVSDRSIGSGSFLIARLINQPNPLLWDSRSETPNLF